MKNSKSNHLSQYLGDQFNQMAQGNRAPKAPEELKGEVFDTLDTLSLMGDVMDLFLVKFPHAESIIIDSITEGLEEDASSEQKEK